MLFEHAPGLASQAGKNRQSAGEVLTKLVGQGVRDALYCGETYFGEVEHRGDSGDVDPPGEDHVVQPARHLVPALTQIAVTAEHELHPMLAPPRHLARAL